MASFNLQIVTQQTTVFDGTVDSLVLPGEEGFFGVLANHAPIVAVLREGPLTMRTGKVEKEIKIGGGFFEMESNTATLLADWQEGLEPETETEEE